MFFATIVKVKNELSNNVMQKQLKALFLIATETGKWTNTKQSQGKTTLHKVRLCYDYFGS